MDHYEYKTQVPPPEEDNFDITASATPVEEPQPASESAPAHFAPKSKSKLPVVIILCVVTALAVGVGLFFGVKALADSAAEPERETVFVEQKTELIKRGEKIQINDPELGLIAIEAIEGAAKNTYDNDSFRYDENGFLAYYIDEKKASCIGVDLSEYQGDVDFDALKNAGVDYVMLRIGGRYYGDEGALYDDSAFVDYYRAAKDAGLSVGAYFFSQAASVEDGVEEAEYAVEQLDGLTLDYPLAFDWEIIADDEARTDAVTGEMLTDIAEAFCDTVSESGYRAIVYSNTSLMYYMYDLSRMKDYEFWVADYGDYPSMYYGFTMWQYTTEGTVDGIEGTVDLNICFKNY